MATYTCLADLQGKTLKFNDIVYLKGIRYTVHSKFLQEDCLDNDKIFDVLSISSKEKFVSNAYGYDCYGSVWPECEPNDYEALTRCVIELYKIIEEKTSSITSKKEQKNKVVNVFISHHVGKDAIEVYPTTEITTIKQEEKHENQFQRKKARIERGTRPEGSTVCGRRGKASVAVGHLGYRKVTGI